MRYLPNPMKLEEGLYRLQIINRSFRMYAYPMYNKLPLAIRSDPYIYIYINIPQKTRYRIYTIDIGS